MTHSPTMRRGGEVEFAFVGDSPFGRGNRLPAGASLPTWRKKAGMDWSIASSPVQFTSSAGEVVTVGDRRVLHRSDNLLPLGVVAMGYKPVQPEAVIEFFDDLIRKAGFAMDVAGTIFGGRRFFAMARIGEEAMHDGADPVRGYLLLATSADGSTATVAKVSTFRLRCTNQLSAMLGSHGGGGMVKTYHSAEFSPEQVKSQIGVAPRAFETFMADMRRLADVEVDRDAAERMTLELLGDADETPTSKAIMDRFDGAAIGYDEPGFAGTAWGWLNSVTEFADHGRKVKSESHRLNSSMFGRGDRLKSRARDAALALLT